MITIQVTFETTQAVFEFDYEDIGELLVDLAKSKSGYFIDSEGVAVNLSRAIYFKVI